MVVSFNGVRGAVRTGASVVAMAAALAAQPAVAAPITWTGGVGNWDVGGNWSAGIPTIADDVFIDGGVAGNSVVTVSGGGVRNIRSLTISTGDELQIRGAIDFRLSTGALTNSGIVRLGGVAGASNYFNTTPSVFSGGGRFIIDDSAGTARLYGSTLTNSAGHTIEGAGQIGINNLGLTNAGLIVANVAGRTLSIDTSGGSGSVGFADNTGTIRATGGGIVRFEGGRYVNAGGLIEAQAGSVVELNGDARILGGTLTSVGTGRIAKLAGERAYLNDFTLTSGTVLTVRQGDFLYVGGAIANNGTIEVRGVGGVQAAVFNESDVTLSGAGQVILDNADGNARFYGNALTNSATHTIRGSGELGINQLDLTNAGLIVADVNGQTLSIDTSGGSGSPGFADNTGTIRATGGGIVRFEGGRYVNTAGLIQAQAGSVVELNGDARILGGTLTSVGTGRIAKVANQRAYLNDVTLTSGTVLTVRQGEFQYVGGAIANNGTIEVRGVGGVQAAVFNESDVTLSGAGEVILDNADGNARFYGNALTNSATHTIRGSGELGINQLDLTNAGLIVANVAGRTLAIDTSGGSGSVGFADNTGTIRATGGGIVRFEGGRYVNAGGLIEAQANSTVELNSDSRILGGTLTSVGTGRIAKVANARAYLNDVTLTSGTVLTVREGDFQYVNGAIVNNGTIEVRGVGAVQAAIYGESNVVLSGTGQIILDDLNGGARLYGSQWTLGDNQTIRGSGQLGINDIAIVNEGLIVGDVNGRTLSIDTSGGSGSVGFFSNADGTVRATGGGIVRFEGGRYDNTGGTVEALADSVVELGSDSRILSGTLSSTGSGRIAKVATARAYLNDVTLTSGTVLTVREGDFLYLNGAIANSGTIEVRGVGGGQAAIFNESNVTLSGPGEVILDSSNGNALFYSSVLTNGAAHTIRGSGQLGINSVNIVNNGLIAGDAAGRNLSIDVSGGSGSVGFFSNVGGTVRAANGGTVSFEGGRYDNTGGTFEALNGSTLVMNNDANLPNLAGTTLTGGTYRSVATGGGSTVRLRGGTGTIATIGADATVELSGAGSVMEIAPIGGGVFTPIDATLTSVAAGGTFRVLNGRNFTVVAGGGAFSNAGTVQLGGGGFGAASYANSGESFGFGSVTVDIANTGTVRANGGTLATRRIQGTTGALIVDPGATLDISAGSGNSTANTLAMNGALGLGTRNVTITSDYTNANFGAGDAFNGRANVSGSGLILAAGATQVLSGPGVSGGAGATPTIDLGAIRVGGVASRTVTVTNNGAQTTLRGAAQGTAAPSITISDADFVLAPGGGSHAFTINFSGIGAGSLAGQSIAVVNNFDNVPDQVAGLTGAAYNAAVGEVTPAVVALGNFRVGASATGAIAINNTAPAGPFSEGLRVTGTSATGDASVSGVTSGLIVAGGSDAATVSINTATTGAKSGTVNFDFSTDGTGISGLAPMAIAGDLVTVSAGVFALANPIIAGSLDFGNVQQGTLQTRTLTVENQLLAGVLASFQEGLNASFGTISGDVQTATGSIVNLGSGATDTSTLIIRLNTDTAGGKSGTAEVLLASNGATTSGLGLFSLPSQNVAVLGTVELDGGVYRLAQAGLAPTFIDLGNRRVGDATPAPAVLTITNTAINDGFSEKLDAASGARTGRATAAGGPIGLLAAQDNSTSISVGIDTSAAGANGTVTINFASNGLGTSGAGVTPLASQVVTLGGAVYRTAAANVSNPGGTITARVGDSAGRTIVIANTAVADGFSESLGVTSSASGTGVSFSNPNGLIAAGGSRNVTAAVDTSSAGAKSGTLDLGFTSDGAGTSGLAAIALAGGSATVNANVYAAAVADVTPGTIDFGVVRVGDAVATRAVTIANTATGALTDTLATTVAGVPSGFTAGAAPGPISSGGMAELMVGIDTAAAGVRSGELDLDFASRNPVLAELALGSESVTLMGTVNNHANAAFLRNGATLSYDAGLGGYVFNFGTVTQGATINLSGFSLGNLVAGPADELSGTVEDMNLGDAFSLAAPLAVGPLGAGELSTLFNVAFDTSTTGLFSGRIDFAGVGTNASDPLGETRLAALYLTGRVNAVAPPVPSPAPIALFGLSAAGLLAVRRRALARAR